MTTYPELLAEGQAEQRTLVTVTRDAQRAVLTLDDPDRLNPLSTGLILQLQQHLAELAADPQLRAIVITAPATHSRPAATWS